MQTVKVTVEDYIAQEFAGCSSPPTTQTVRNWIRAGILEGKKYGRRWYIHRTISTGRPDVDELLRRIS
jgi:hypothetical protein